MHSATYNCIRLIVQIHQMCTYTWFFMYVMHTKELAIGPFFKLLNQGVPISCSYVLLYTGTERMHVFCIKGIPQPPVSLMYQTAFAMVAYYHHMYLWYMSIT